MEMCELIKILACPACHGDLTLLVENGKTAFYCDKCDLAYPVEDDIPVMLESQAMPRAKWEEKDK